MDRIQLTHDLDTVDTNLEYLKEHPDRNFDVTSRGKDYLMPYFWDEFVRPLDNPNGLFMYYSEIKEALEHAIVHDFIPEKKLPRYAPEYLEVLVL